MRRTVLILASLLVGSPILAGPLIPLPLVPLSLCERVYANFAQDALSPTLSEKNATAELRRQKAFLASHDPAPHTVELSSEEFQTPAAAVATPRALRFLASPEAVPGSTPFSSAEGKILRLKKGDTVEVGGKKFELGEFLYADYGAHVFRLADDPGKAIALPFRGGDYFFGSLAPFFAAPVNLGNATVLDKFFPAHLAAKSLTDNAIVEGAAFPRVKVHAAGDKSQYLILDAVEGETGLEFLRGLAETYTPGRTDFLGPQSIEAISRLTEREIEEKISSAYHRHRAGVLAFKLKDNSLEQKKLSKLNDFQLSLRTTQAELKKKKEAAEKKLRDSKTAPLPPAEAEALLAEIRMYEGVLKATDLRIPYNYRNVRWDSTTESWTFTSWYTP